MNNGVFKLDQAWFEFREQSLATQIYIGCFVLIFASGQTALHGYVPQIMMVMLAAAAFAVLERERASRGKAIAFGRGINPGTVLLLLVAVFCAFQMGDAFIPGIAKSYSIRYLIYAALTLFVVSPTVFAVCMRFVAAYLNVCAVSLILSSVLLGAKTGGFLGNYQAGGMMISIACVLNIIDYYRSDRSSTYLWLSLLTAAALLLTGKRTFALIALADVFVLCFFASRHKKPFLKVILVALLVAGVCCVTYEFTDFGKNAFERFALLTSDDEFSAMSGRNLLWDAAWITFQEHPLTGIGFGSFEKWYATFYATNRGAAYLTHNIYYGMLAETGIVGTALFIVLFAWGLVSTARALLLSRRAEHGLAIDYILVSSLALQIWFIAYGFTGNGIYDANEMFFYVIALVMNLSARHAMKGLEQATEKASVEASKETIRV